MTSNSRPAFEVFTEAVQLPTEGRAAFLDRACAGNEELRQKVEALLRSNDRAGDFLEEPPTGSINQAKARVAAGEMPGDRIGRYKLLKQIGEGGCGVVFVAEQEEPVRRRVALKVIKPGMDTKSVIARFEAERQALALMDHPNIAHVFDAGAAQSGRPYFVMELVDGVKISDYCDQHSLPLGERLRLFVQVCDAIQHAHQKGIIHRDIKPSNVLVTTGADGKPMPKVIDFGIAKATTGQQLTDKTIFTAHEMLIGTPAYMSPEQAALTNAEVDTRTDIYSLGVLLYELLTGTTPFDTRELLKAGFDEVRRVIREEEPVRPSTRLTTMTAADLVGVSKHHGAEATKLIREMRGDLDWIVMKALEKDRTRRYATANGLAMDIDRYLSGEAVLARPPNASYRFRKLVARNKLVFSGITLTFILLVISLITTTRWLMAERRTREELRQRIEIGRLESLGWAVTHQGKFEEAVQSFTNAVALRRQLNIDESASSLLFRILILLFDKQKQMERIAPYLSESVDPALLAKEDYADTFDYAIDVLARHGRWGDAHLLAEKLDKSIPTNSWRLTNNLVNYKASLFHTRAPLLVATHDTTEYRRLCGEIISEFRDATNCAVANRMAKDCLILPSSGMDLEPVAALADLAVRPGAKSVSVTFARCCKALAEFRLGHYEESVTWASLETKSSSPHAQAQATAVLAMSHFKLNQLENARTALADCNKVVEEKLPHFERGESDKDWRDWIIAHALQVEAKQMIESGPSSAAPSEKVAD